VRGLVRILCHGSLIPSSASLFRTRITCVAYHLPASGVGIPRAFNVSAALRADRSRSSAKTLRSCSAPLLECAQRATCLRINSRTSSAMLRWSSTVSWHLVSA
jgi:hypothetical protein